MMFVFWLVAGLSVVAAVLARSFPRDLVGRNDGAPAA